MQSYPGATFAVDIRQSAPKPYYEYWVALLPQAKIKHACHLPSKKLSIPIPHPDDTLDFVRQQETYETKDAIDLGTLGSTTRAPLGHVVHARSGDKGSDCNVGFFVRNQDEWDWLRSLLTVDKIREMMGDDDTHIMTFILCLSDFGLLTLLPSSSTFRKVARLPSCLPSPPIMYLLCLSSLSTALTPGRDGS